MKEKRKVKLNKSKLAALALAAVLIVGAGSVNSQAKENELTKTSDYFLSYERESESRMNGTSDYRLRERYKSVKTVSNKNVWAYSRKTVLIGGQALSIKGLQINGIEYIPFRQAANMIGATYNYNSASASSTMRSASLTVSATAGNYVIYANDRPLFSLSPTVIMSDGRMYIPAEVFAKSVGMKLDVTHSSISISGKYQPIKSAEYFYREDEVFWLARIIHAESRGEPLLGEIAVGNVVLNRVRSSYYPNTIYGVIFDRKYGVQFSPVEDGSIYNAPSYNSVLAAKICLEGFDVSDGALFFLRPETSSSSWIPNSRSYLFSIGKHDFYK